MSASRRAGTSSLVGGNVIRCTLGRHYSRFPPRVQNVTASRFAADTLGPAVVPQGFQLLAVPAGLEMLDQVVERDDPDHRDPVGRLDLLDGGERAEAALLAVER